MARKKLNKIQKKQRRLRRDYERIYSKLEKYGQAPINKLDHPWQRDIDRLKKRYATVKKYAEYYYKLYEQVTKFNAEYKQNFELFVPHKRITQGTYETLKKYGARQKMLMRRIKSKVANESNLIEDNLRGVLNVAWEFSQPNRITGQITDKQYKIEHQATVIENLFKKVLPSDPVEKYNALKNLKQHWDKFIQAVERFIYDSDQNRVNESWSYIVYILTGDGSKNSNDIVDSSIEDLVYE